MSANRDFCALTGFDASELVGRRPPYPFWTDREANRAREQMLQAIDDTGDVDLTVRRRDGGTRTVSVSVMPVRDRSGVPSAYVATYIDVSTERAQERLKRTLRGVAAAAVAGPDDPRSVFDQIALHMAQLVGAPAAAVVHFDGNRGVVVGRHAPTSMGLPDELSWRSPPPP